MLHAHRCRHSSTARRRMRSARIPNPRPSAPQVFALFIPGQWRAFPTPEASAAREWIVENSRCDSAIQECKRCQRVLRTRGAGASSPAVTVDLVPGTSAAAGSVSRHGADDTVSVTTCQDHIRVHRKSRRLRQFQCSATPAAARLGHRDLITHWGKQDLQPAFVHAQHSRFRRVSGMSPEQSVSYVSGLNTTP
jgi:hypothetical protein